MKTMECIKDKLKDSIMAQMNDMEHADAQELSEAFDMLKDISMAMYYTSITEAMDEAEYGKDYDEHGRILHNPVDRV